MNSNLQALRGLMNDIWGPVPPQVLPVNAGSLGANLQLMSLDRVNIHCTAAAARVLETYPMLFLHHELYGFRGNEGHDRELIRYRYRGEPALNVLRGFGKSDEPQQHLIVSADEVPSTHEGTVREVSDLSLEPLKLFQCFQEQVRADIALSTTRHTRLQVNRRGWKFTGVVMEGLAYMPSQIPDVVRVLLGLNLPFETQGIEIGMGVGGVTWVMAMFMREVLGIDIFEPYLRQARLSLDRLRDTGALRGNVTLQRKSFRGLRLSDYGFVYTAPSTEEMARDIIVRARDMQAGSLFVLKGVFSTQMDIYGTAQFERITEEGDEAVAYRRV